MAPREVWPPGRYGPQGGMAPRTLSCNILPAVYNATLSGIAGSALVFNVRRNVKGKNKKKNMTKRYR